VSDVYPKRPKFFACQFARKLIKKTVANEIGTQGCWLLTVVAMTEDARGYTDPVTFYNGQLLPLVGVGSVDALDRVRRRCIEAGWLHYIPGGRREGPGRYWVTVPAKYAGTDDAPTDEDSDEDTLFRTGAEQTAEQCAEQTAEQTASKPRNLLPVPAPIPFAADSASAVAVATNPAAKTKPAPREKKPRQRNPLYDAIANVTGLDPETAGGCLGTASAALSRADPPYTPADVHEFGRRFLDLCPYARGERDRPSPGELQKYIGLLRAGPSPGRATAPRLASLGEALALDNGEIHPPAPSR
jgi:hypothetical protein